LPWQTGWKVFTARYGLSPYIKQTRLVFRAKTESHINNDIQNESILLIQNGRSWVMRPSFLCVTPLTYFKSEKRADIQSRHPLIACQFAIPDYGDSQQNKHGKTTKYAKFRATRAPISLSACSS
jgi:hypothetical protein